jgi:hypothetical protein
VGLVTEAEELLAAIGQFADYVRGETLAVEIKLEALPAVEPIEVDVAGHRVLLYVTVA